MLPTAPANRLTHILGLSWRIFQAQFLAGRFVAECDARQFLGPQAS